MSISVYPFFLIGLVKNLCCSVFLPFTCLVCLQVYEYGNWIWSGFIIFEVFIFWNGSSGYLVELPGTMWRCQVKYYCIIIVGDGIYIGRMAWAWLGSWIGNRLIHRRGVTIFSFFLGERRLTGCLGWAFIFSCSEDSYRLPGWVARSNWGCTKISLLFTSGGEWASVIEKWLTSMSRGSSRWLAYYIKFVYVCQYWCHQTS